MKLQHHPPIYNNRRRHLLFVFGRARRHGPCDKAPARLASNCKQAKRLDTCMASWAAADASNGGVQGQSYTSNTKLDFGAASSGVADGGGRLHHLASATTGVIFWLSPRNKSEIAELPSRCRRWCRPRPKLTRRRWAPPTPRLPWPRWEVP